MIQHRQSGGHGRHCQQQDQHHVAELIQQDPPAARARRQGQPVGTFAGQAFGRDGLAQARLTDLETPKAFLPREGLPGRGLGMEHGQPPGGYRSLGGFRRPTFPVGIQVAVALAQQVLEAAAAR